jgi:hypothetical protein
MQKTILFYLFVLSTITSCTVDYDVKGVKERIPDKIVINSILTPGETISVSLGVVNKADSGYVYRAANDMQVKLTEDGRVLYDGICEDTLLTIAPTFFSHV